MEPLSKAVISARVLACCIAMIIAAMAFLGPITRVAQAAPAAIDSSGTSATIPAPTSTKCSEDKTGKALWNHGSFYVYFFQGTKSVKTSLVKASGSDTSTLTTKVGFEDGVSWAKVDIAAVSSSAAGNGGKSARLKSNAGKSERYASYLASSKSFYVWISDQGGNGGKISLRGTTNKTVYANARSYKNVDVLTVSSQHGASHHDLGATESPYCDVLNIPFKWSGKQSEQIPYRVVSSRGVGNNDKLHTFYRLSWKQYSNGTTYSGYSPYKLQHGVSDALNIWTSVNLASTGISLAPTYTDESLKTPTGKLYRNQNCYLVCCLKKPREQVLLDTDGGTLSAGKTNYSGNSEPYKKGYCDSTVKLPSDGYKIGKDGSKEGYKLIGYAWKSGANRARYASTSPKSKSPFIAFDQSKLNNAEGNAESTTLCNHWQLPAFGPDNMSYEDGGFLKSPSVAEVTFKARWKALPFTIHYIVNGQETKTTEIEYDSPYRLDSAPSSSSGWAIRKQDGSAASPSGNMPAQDLYAYAQTEESSTVRYFIDGKLAAQYSIPFGQEPLATTYTGKDSGGIEFNDDGAWSIENGTFSATYKEHYNVPDKINCSHYVDTSYYVNGYPVSDGYWEEDDEGYYVWVDKSYYVPGYWVNQGYYEHDYDEQDNWSYYTTKTYSVAYGAPGNPNGGTWHGWYSDQDCTSKAAGTRSFRAGDCLSFYSYTTHRVSYVVNGSIALEEEHRFGEAINPYSHGEDLNRFGGTLKHWYEDDGFSQKVPETVSVSRDDIRFLGYTEHIIHFWMDAGAKTSSINEADGDDGVDADPKELSYCRLELPVRYGATLQLPSDEKTSKSVTRAGCEDWLTSNGAWYEDENCKREIKSFTCTGDRIVYSFNYAKLSYELSEYAESLERDHQLLDKSGKQVFLGSFLPASKLYRYGSTVKIAGDGSVYWKTSGGFTRSARSVKGGFLDKEANGNASKTLVMQQSTTVFKQWAQGLFDGITTA